MSYSDDNPFGFIMNTVDAASQAAAQQQLLEQQRQQIELQQLNAMQQASFNAMLMAGR